MTIYDYFFLVLSISLNVRGSRLYKLWGNLDTMGQEGES